MTWEEYFFCTWQIKKQSTVRNSKESGGDGRVEGGGGEGRINSKVLMDIFRGLGCVSASVVIYSDFFTTRTT